MGRLNILADVHGYATSKGVMVPLRGVAEWLGATVDYAPPTIVVKLGKRSVTLKLGASSATVNGKKVALAAPAHVYGAVTCVPVRFVAEGLGAEVDYRSASGDPEVERMAGHSFVQIRSRGKESRVIVHRVPPDVVGLIVKAGEGDLRRSGFPCRYGWDWIFSVDRALKHGYVWSEPYHSWEAMYPDNREQFSPEGDNGIIWHQLRGAWRVAGHVGLDNYRYAELRQAGVPADVVEQIRSR